MTVSTMHDVQMIKITIRDFTLEASMLILIFLTYLDLCEELPSWRRNMFFDTDQVFFYWINDINKVGYRLRVSFIYFFIWFFSFRAV